MLVRLYAIMWILLAVAAAGLFFGGYLNERVFIIVGLFTATLVFMGMIAVLPSSVAKGYAR